MKKYLIGILLIIILAACAILFWKQVSVIVKNNIVFLHRDNEVLSLYTINPDGSDRKLIYRHSDPVNANIINPKWSTDSTIIFAAMKDKEWKIFSIDKDGSNLKLTNLNDPNFLVSQESRDKNIIVEGLGGQKEYTIYRLDNGEKIKVYTTECASVCSAGGPIHEVSFSPDKKHIIFDKEKDIMIIDADGKKPHILTEGESADWR
ncbi:MAG: hypothetical protein WCO16_01920 [bacterium]